MFGIAVSTVGLKMLAKSDCCHWHREWEVFPTKSVPGQKVANFTATTRAQEQDVNPVSHLSCIRAAQMKRWLDKKSWLVDLLFCSQEKASADGEARNNVYSIGKSAYLDVSIEAVELTYTAHLFWCPKVPQSFFLPFPGWSLDYVHCWRSQTASATSMTHCGQSMCGARMYIVGGVWQPVLLARLIVGSPCVVQECTLLEESDSQCY